MEIVDFVRNIVEFEDMKLQRYVCRFITLIKVDKRLEVSTRKAWIALLQRYKTGLTIPLPDCEALLVAPPIKWIRENGGDILQLVIEDVEDTVAIKKHSRMYIG